jgi:methionine-R-sulfoxide reductase
MSLVFDYSKTQHYTGDSCYLNEFLIIKTKPMLTWKDVLAFADNGNPEPDRRVEKTEDEWRAQLTPEQFRITRLKGTERRGTGEYCKIYDPGIYACICCGTPLFDSTIKYESGSGWPAFSQPIKENAIKYEADNSFGMRRVEVMCNVCDAHQGHVFPDGPPPSGLRYCINSESIKLEENHEQ